MKNSGRWLHVSLAFFLLLFWLALSGVYTPFMIGLGVVSALLCTWAAHRIKIIDTEGHPVAFLPRAPIYFPWLIKEIIKSGWPVARIILDPKLPISPAMTTVFARQRTAAGISAFANSVMLTAGSFVVRIHGRELSVHALEGQSAIELEQGEMNDRVCRFEGST